MPRLIPDTNEFLAEFRHTLIFQHLNFAETEEILASSRVETVYEGEYLVHEGDDPTHLLFILDGHLITYRTSQQGDEVSIRLLNKGECCMDAVIFMGGASPIGVKATYPSSVLKIPADMLKKFMRSNYTLAENLLGTVASYYRESLLQIDSLTIKDTKTRLGYYLLREFIRSDSISPNFRLQFKKNVVANYLGMKPETLSRTLKQLQKEGHIHIVGENVALDDQHKLCQYCDEVTSVACHETQSMDNSNCHLRKKVQKN